jgi:SAM-dependent methyltransferase
VKAAEFDKFAEEYLAIHARNVRISGENPEYFARYKVEETRRLWTAGGQGPPAAILDFGVGIGNSLPHLAQAFPAAEITGLDVSERSLALAAARFPKMARLVPFDGTRIPLPKASFDLIFSACVFHHIEASEHVPLLTQLRQLLRPGGQLVIFEHNPVNPLTAWTVSRCPFDDNAVLIRTAALRRRLHAAGFRDVKVSYTFFFPRALAALRPLERLMKWLPLGAQYYTVSKG